MQAVRKLKFSWKEWEKFPFWYLFWAKNSLYWWFIAKIICFFPILKWGKQFSDSLRGRSLSPPTSRAYRPLPGALLLFRPVPGGVWEPFRERVWIFSAEYFSWFFFPREERSGEFSRFLRLECLQGHIPALSIRPWHLFESWFIIPHDDWMCKWGQRCSLGQPSRKPNSYILN